MEIGRLVLNNNIRMKNVIIPSFVKIKRPRRSRLSTSTASSRTSDLEREEQIAIIDGETVTGGIAIREDVKTLSVQGQLKESLKVFHVMDQHGINVDCDAYASILHGCVYNKSLPEGKLIHAHIIKTGFGLEETFLGNRLLIMYAKLRSLLDARRVFDGMPERDVVSWTVMIAAYARHGQGEEAWTLFGQMKRTGLRPNQFTYASILSGCTNMAALQWGKQVHGEIIKNGFQVNVFVGSALVDMYVKCRSIEDAREVFNEMPEQDVVSWTSMIAGFAQNGHIDEARELFQRMPERNMVSWNVMIAGYAQNGNVNEASMLFLKMPKRDVVSWNAMITGYAQNGHIEKAMVLFQKMPEKDVISWNSMITGCVQNGYLDEALKIFQKMAERTVISWTAMIAGYVQHGFFDEALKLFQEMPERNVVSWTAMIAGYAQNGYFDEALKLFRQMQLAGVKPNSDTFSSVLPACAGLASLEHGKEVHKDIIRSEFQSHVFVGSALVDMYAKCGSIEDACKVFGKIPRHDVILWTAMIVGYAMNGFGKDAIKLFEQMQHSGVNPDRVTFIGVLSACCHSGFVENGLQYFSCMTQVHHITPTIEHYSCMVDLLGRAGLLNEAQDIITKMPLKPNTSIWVSLLSACRIHSNIELAECVAKHLFELDPENAAVYVLLSNIYASAGRWDDSNILRKAMKDKIVKMKPGCSCIEVNKQVYAFLVGDQSQPQKEKIYRKLENIVWADERKRVCARHKFCAT